MLLGFILPTKTKFMLVNIHLKHKEYFSMVGLSYCHNGGLIVLAKIQIMAPKSHFCETPYPAFYNTAGLGQRQRETKQMGL
jgi:hypothetical protein